jgi:alpha-L-fucosidase 2
MDKSKIILSVVLFFALAFNVQTATAADEPNSVKVPERGFISSRPANRWEEALISGNGKMGAMVFGRPLEETIILNRAGLFMPLNKPLPPVDTASHLSEIRKMISDGQYQKAADYVVELSHKEGWGEKRWTDPLVPAFDLLVKMNNEGEATGYMRSLDFQTGVASVQWEQTSGKYLRRLFVSRPDNVVVLSITGPGKEKVDCELQLAQRPTKNQGGWGAEEMFKNGIKDVQISAENNWLTYRSSFRQGWAGSLQGYEGVARVITKNGKAKSEGNKIIVSGADEVLVLIRIELTKDFAKPGIETLKKSLAKITDNYETLLNRHSKMHGEIFNRVKLDLGGGPDRNLTSEELFAKSKVGNLSKALLEKEFDACRYGILSCSGDYPPTLQGMWGGTWGPPWSNDYTQNGNLQSALAGILCANMPECMEAFFRYMDSQMADYRENARRMFGARGINVPSRTSSHGLNNHFDGTWPMTFWTAGAGWNASFYYDYYLYTGDKKFLADKAIPFMKDAAAFYEDFLIEDSNGKYVFNPSYSPENNPANNSSQACINATMDIAVAKELLHNLIAACEEMKTDPEGVKRWKAMLTKMPDYMINNDGAIKEWTTPLLEDNYTHRHCSHLYALFNGLPEEIEKNPELQKAFKRAIELRMEVRRKEKGGGVQAFGLVQLGLAASSLRDADMSYEIVDWLANNFWYRSAMNTSHDPGSIFNVDLRGGLPAVIIRMLVDSQPGKTDSTSSPYIKLLPALPKEWPSGKIEGIPCRGQVLIKSLEWNPDNITVKLKSAIKQEVNLKVFGTVSSIKLIKGRAEISNLNLEKGSCVLSLPAAEDIILEIRR